MGISGAQCVIIILVLFYIFSPGGTIWRNNLVPTSAGNRQWNVVGSYDNHAEAAALLQKTHSSLLILLRHLRKKYHIDEPADIIAAEDNKHNRAVNAPNNIYGMANYLLDHYNPEVFYENDPAVSSGTSYTVNKGVAMYICVRDRANPAILVDSNTLLFTILHEAAHIANYEGWGHEPQFWAVFKWLLYEAKLVGIYSPTDYEHYPVSYCGLQITYQPLYDNTLPNLWR